MRRLGVFLRLMLGPRRLRLLFGLIFMMPMYFDVVAFLWWGRIMRAWSIMASRPREATCLFVSPMLWMLILRLFNEVMSTMRFLFMYLVACWIILTNGVGFLVDVSNIHEFFAPVFVVS